tara:strand:- start:874 stop:1302 length:429 start_codon:yes stop_codon:yes gene_type:complete
MGFKNSVLDQWGINFEITDVDKSLDDLHGIGVEYAEVKPSVAPRKEMPVFSGVLNYFPDAIREVSRTSFIGNEQHNKGLPLHWDRSKSGDELDALTRHLLEAGTVDSDGIRHSAKVAWRALANLQKELEAVGDAPLSEYNND